jgi:SAM-dependent methyltransferase
MNEGGAEIRDKWDRIYREAGDAIPEPAPVLADNAHLLPVAGIALDLACGLGGNALFLARQGLDTHAWDISPEAIRRLNACARRLGLILRTEIRDVVEYPPAEESCDVIVVSRFLERSLVPAISQALKPGGLLFYQTYTREKAAEVGPTNPAFLLDTNELLRLFSSLRLVFYREEGQIGDPACGSRNQAFFVGRKT